MVTIEELINRMKELAKSESNHGYAKQQEMRKEMFKRRFLDQLKTDYHEIADHLGTEDFTGIGYFSCYSDFLPRDG